jgi:hypothetical protein
MADFKRTGIFLWNLHFSFCSFHFSIKLGGFFQKAKLILTFYLDPWAFFLGSFYALGHLEGGNP